MSGDVLRGRRRELPPGRLADRRRHLVAEIEREHPRRWLRVVRRRPAYVLIAALVALAGAASGVALSSGLRGFLGLPSGAVHPIYSRARLLVTAPGPRDLVLRLYTTPSSNGGVCTVLAILRAGSTGPDASPLTCTSRGTSLHSVETPLELGVGLERRPPGPRVRGWLPAYVTGWVNPRLQATRVELVWRRGRQRLPLANHYFLAAPAILYRSAFGGPAFADLPFRIVAYNARGRVVASGKLQSSGLYLDWKRDHVRARLAAYWRVHGRP